MIDSNAVKSKMLTSGKPLQPAQSSVVNFGHSSERSMRLQQYVKLIVSSRGQTIDRRNNWVVGGGIYS